MNNEVFSNNIKDFFLNKQCHLLHYKEAIPKGVHKQKANTKNKAPDATTKPKGEIRARRPKIVN
jgi:hypothetical protein